MTLKLVSSNTKPKSATVKRRKDWYSVHKKLPAPNKSLLVKYRYNPETYEGKIFWDVAYATGRYNGGIFEFDDKLLNQHLCRNGHFLCVTDWRYISLNRYEGYRK